MNATATSKKKITSLEKSTWPGESIRLIKKPGSFFCSPLTVLTSTWLSPLIKARSFSSNSKKREIALKHAHSYIIMSNIKQYHRISDKFIFLQTKLNQPNQPQHKKFDEKKNSLRRLNRNAAFLLIFTCIGKTCFARFCSRYNTRFRYQRIR